MCDGVRRSAAELHRLVIVFELSPFNVWLDGRGPGYPAGWDPARFGTYGSQFHAVTMLWLLALCADMARRGLRGRLSPLPASVKPGKWKIPATGVDPVNLRVMSPARCRCATPVNERGTQVPRTTPLRGGGLRGRSCPPFRFCKADELEDTGNRFRSCDLAVMSRARCPCAIPVNERGTQVPRTTPLRGGGSEGALVPPLPLL